jgi:hypothetical protein
VLRGYGGDEPLVHETLNPGSSSCATPIACAARERRTRRADCVVLDDAFQHRRLARTADWVLVSAERFSRTTHVLPAVRCASRSRRSRAPTWRSSRARSRRSPSRCGGRAHRVVGAIGAAVVHLAPSALVDARDGTSRG